MITWTSDKEIKKFIEQINKHIGEEVMKHIHKEKKQSKIYSIYTEQGECEIIANSIEIHDDYLLFFKDEDEVACFRNWNFYTCVPDDIEECDEEDCCNNNCNCM